MVLKTIENELDMLVDFSRQLGAKETEYTDDPNYQNCIEVEKRILTYSVEEIKRSIIEIVGEST